MLGNPDTNKYSHTMDHSEPDKLLEQLVNGFEKLQEEYQKLFGQHQALERKLVTAREQVSDNILSLVARKQHGTSS
jgi:hypothetical protein